MAHLQFGESTLCNNYNISVSNRLSEEEFNLKAEGNRCRTCIRMLAQRKAKTNGSESGKSKSSDTGVSG